MHKPRNLSEERSDETKGALRLAPLAQGAGIDSLREREPKRRFLSEERSDETKGTQGTHRNR